MYIHYDSSSCEKEFEDNQLRLESGLTEETITHLFTVVSLSEVSPYQLVVPLLYVPSYPVSIEVPFVC